MLQAWRRESLLSTATLLVTLSATRPVLSQQESVAESLFRQAREEMKRDEPAAACPKFEESYRLDPSIGTLLNLALCEEALGHTATAWTKIHQFLDAAPVTDSRLPLARTKAAKLEAELPRLQLVIEPGGAQTTVELDDIELRNASLSQAIPVNPGEHVLRVKRPTGEKNETIFRIRPAETLVLRASVPPELAPVGAPAAVSAVTPYTAQPAPSAANSPSTPTVDRGRERTAGYALGAVGVAGLVTSGVFGLMALHDRNVVRDQCPDHDCQSQAGLDAAESGQRNTTVANVAFGVGVIGLVTGGLLVWHAGRATAAASVTPNSASLSLAGFIQ